MATFPPKKATKTPNYAGDKTEGGLVSTGNGGIPKSLSIKAAGTKDAPGKEKTVLEF